MWEVTLSAPKCAQVVMNLLTDMSQAPRTLENSSPFQNMLVSLAGSCGCWILTQRRDDCGKEREKGQHIDSQHRLALTEEQASEHLNLALGCKDREGGKQTCLKAEPVTVKPLTGHSKYSLAEGKPAQPDPSDQPVLVQSKEHDEHKHVKYF